MITMPSAAVRQRYVDLVGKSRIIRMKNLEQLVRHKEEHVTAIQISLVDHIRDLGVTREEYRLSCIETPELAETKGMEFDKLMSNPDIEDFSVDDTYIYVTTGPIYIEYQEKVYDIGRFKITLSINPRNFIVNMKNLTRTVFGTAHPHIYANGQPCLGNIQECLPNMVGDYQFGAAILVCIQYLKSVNPDGGHYSNIKSWPLKKVEEKEQDVKE